MWKLQFPLFSRLQWRSSVSPDDHASSSVACHVLIQLLIHFSSSFSEKPEAIIMAGPPLLLFKASFSTWVLDLILPFSSVYPGIWLQWLSLLSPAFFPCNSSLSPVSPPPVWKHNAHKCLGRSLCAVRAQFLLAVSIISTIIIFFFRMLLTELCHNDEYQAFHIQVLKYMLQRLSPGRTSRHSKENKN